ncbi:MAG: sensor histidine kinase [Bacteroidales bacterium]
MKIKTKLTINFTLLVAGILAVASFSVYLFSLRYRQYDFYLRLRHKALNTATLLLNIKDISPELLKIIDETTISTLRDVKVWVLDESKNILYSNTDSASTAKILPAFSYMRWTDSNFRTKDDKIYLCIVYNYNKHKYYVLTTAEDYYGMAELRNLRFILFIVFAISMLLTVLAAILNTRQSLQPIKELIRQVDKITASNLHRRLTVANNKDEIAELAKTFNKMLERLEKAFETERMFVSNASHELRTPVTAIKGQIEVTLLKNRPSEEYQRVLSSILDDVNNMSTIINGFLELAEANTEPARIKFEKVRLDELIFSVQDDLSRQNKGYSVCADFERFPEDEDSITVRGNPRLLKIMISNLIDNACKFSSNKKVTVKINYDDQRVDLKFIDEGIGIPEDEIKYIFEPLYRTRNSLGQAGSGIGLSIVNRIALLHQADVKVHSELNKGTVFHISIPRNVAAEKTEIENII